MFKSQLDCERNELRISVDNIKKAHSDSTADSELNRLMDEIASRDVAISQVCRTWPKRLRNQSGSDINCVESASVFVHIPRTHMVPSKLRSGVP